MRLKVLILTNLFPHRYDPHRSAFNRQQFERLAAIDDVEVMIAVAFPQRLGGAKGDPGIAGIRTREFTFVYPPRIGRALHPIFWLTSLLARFGLELRRSRYDCLLASWTYPDGVATSWLARWLGLPYVIKVHGSDLNVLAESRWRRPQIARALRGAAAVVTVSAALADKCRDLGVAPGQIHVLYNGIDTARFCPGPRELARRSLALPLTDRLILFVGNLKAAKGCIDLIEAYVAVRSRVPSARLVFVGDGPERAGLEARAKAAGVGDEVRLSGVVPHAALADWYRAADLLCLPSHAEGVPNVVLEAMACGIPTVATAVGGIPEVLPDTAGVLVPPNDATALSDALYGALERHWDSHSIAACAKRYRWDDNVRALDAILRQAAGTKTTMERQQGTPE